MFMTVCTHVTIVDLGILERGGFIFSLMPKNKLRGLEHVPQKLFRNVSYMFMTAFTHVTVVDLGIWKEEVPSFHLYQKINCGIWSMFPRKCSKKSCNFLQSEQMIDIYLYIISWIEKRTGGSSPGPAFWVHH